MSTQFDPVVQAVLEATLALTGAASGWVVAPNADHQALVFAVSSDTDSALIGEVVGEETGATGFVIATGQPLSLSKAANDERFADHPLGDGSGVSCVLCVPCHFRGEAIGAIELINDLEGVFALDDLEISAEIASIAGAALATHVDRASSAPSPAEFAAELVDLAASDPARYIRVADLLGAVLSSA